MNEMSSGGVETEILPLKEDVPPAGRWIARIFQKYWRLARGFRLSVEAFVIDEAGRILMVRDEDGANWKLPRGQVIKNENLEMALRRVLGDAAAIEVNDRPELMFFYAGGRTEQRGVYLVRHWQRSAAHTGPETRFFSFNDLPPGLDPEVRVRIGRLVEGRTISQV
jgi:ADP-ribose pyrophosphatase YjhB (NUDIX family)